VTPATRLGCVTTRLRDDDGDVVGRQWAPWPSRTAAASETASCVVIIL
jgi:hypothetical protein